MKLGDRIKLVVSSKKTFGTEFEEDVNGEYIVIAIDKQLPHCFGNDMYSNGFNHFEYGQTVEGRPAVVRKGSIYTATPELLDEVIMEEMVYDNKIVSWKVL